MVFKHLIKAICKHYYSSIFCNFISSCIGENVLQSTRDNLFYFHLGFSLFKICSVNVMPCADRITVKASGGKVCTQIQETVKLVKLLFHVERCSALCKTRPKEWTEAADLLTLRWRKGFSFRSVFTYLHSSDRPQLFIC